MWVYGWMVIWNGVVKQVSIMEVEEMGNIQVWMNGGSLFRVCRKTIEVLR